MRRSSSSLAAMRRPPGLLLLARPSSLRLPLGRPRDAQAAEPTRASAAAAAAAAAAATASIPQRYLRRCNRRAATVIAAASSNGTSSTSPPPQKLYDVVGVSNLCVDVFLPVGQLPPADAKARRALLARLTADPPPQDAWEVGGSCNFMIAAARLGLRVAAVGHTGADAAGAYLEDVLRREGVGPLLQLAPHSFAEDAETAPASGPRGAAAALAAALEAAGPGAPDENDNGVLVSAAAAEAAARQTLLCFVLVDPSGGHAFCSAYDFGPWPLLMGALEASAAQREGGAVTTNGNGSLKQAQQPYNNSESAQDAAAAARLLPPAVLDALRSTRALYLNGFVFDELPLQLVRALCRAAADAGAAVVFDPGPRAHTMREGERRAALDAVLDLSDVVLMTEEEAAEVTGVRGGDAAGAARAVLDRPGCRTRWSVVKRGAEGAVLVAKAPRRGRNGAAAENGYSNGFAYRQYASPAVPVDVRDTVGCGDSFAAAAVLGFIGAGGAVDSGGEDEEEEDEQAAAAAVAAGRLVKARPEETLALANAVGAATAMGRGAGTNVASAPQVLQLLEGQVAVAGGGGGGGSSNGNGNGASSSIDTPSPLSSSSAVGRPSSPGSNRAHVVGAIRMLRASLDGSCSNGSSASGSPTGGGGGEDDDDGNSAVAAAQEAAAARLQEQQQGLAPPPQQQEQQRARRRERTTAA
jgi:sugar/nucleoside kinase (ribokinase family)